MVHVIHVMKLRLNYLLFDKTQINFVLFLLLPHGGANNPIYLGSNQRLFADDDLYL